MWQAGSGADGDGGVSTNAARRGRDVDEEAKRLDRVSTLKKKRNRISRLDDWTVASQGVFCASTAGVMRPTEDFAVLALTRMPTAVDLPLLVVSEVFPLCSCVFSVVFRCCLLQVRRRLSLLDLPLASANSFFRHFFVR